MFVSSFKIPMGFPYFKSVSADFVQTALTSIRQTNTSRSRVIRSKKNRPMRLGDKIRFEIWYQIDCPSNTVDSSKGTKSPSKVNWPGRKPVSLALVLPSAPIKKRTS